MDEKAAVRKAGLQLLEALLMMRAQGAGGSDPELPTEQDIRALEAATADALVWLHLQYLLFSVLPCLMLCCAACKYRTHNREIWCFLVRLHCAWRPERLLKLCMHMAYQKACSWQARHHSRTEHRSQPWDGIPSPSFPP